MRAGGELTGTWEGVVTMDADGSKMSVVFEFKTDGTFSERINLFSAGRTLDISPHPEP